MPHIERCELLRHCRWVDEVVPDAPWTLDETFLRSRRIDYVAIDEGISIDPACDCDRLKGYDLVKSIREYCHVLSLQVRFFLALNIRESNPNSTDHWTCANSDTTCGQGFRKTQGFGIQARNN